MAANVITRLVEWGDCDPAGIVFYPNFYRWFDQGTWALFRALGLSPAVVSERYGSFGAPLVDTGARFILPARPGDQISVETKVESLTDKSLRLAHSVTCGDKLIAEGFEVRVWGMRDPADPSRIRAAAIPDEVRKILA